MLHPHRSYAPSVQHLPSTATATQQDITPQHASTISPNHSSGTQILVAEFYPQRIRLSSRKKGAGISRMRKSKSEPLRSQEENYQFHRFLGERPDFRILGIG